ncbi:MAG TPA: hypothetical protein VLX92_11150 [Kofleriaceae bacterium]|nr:hypothetical protein [Kofleriaceae bacterium]
MLLRCLPCLAAVACHQAADQSLALPPEIDARDASGTIVGHVRPGHPCRASVGAMELIVGGDPLVAQLGDVRWSGERTANGTVLLRDGVAIARIHGGDVIDPSGVALIRTTVQGGTATVSDAAGRALRRLKLAPTGITIDHPATTVTGTTDLVLAALLTAPELDSEVRMLAACERVL